MKNRSISQEKDEGGEEERGRAERGRRMGGSTLLCLTDEDERMDKVSMRVKGEHLSSGGFDNESRSV